ncbi:MAG: hypothetical protein IT326_01250 [Anaerolineae bacterium]|nr:hypothetical protein [Anaerolineae bacterium]
MLPGIEPRPPAIPDLRPDQAGVATHPARFKVVACGRRWGKTTLGLYLAAEAMRRGRRVWWVAPTYNMAFEPWLALKQAFEGADGLVKQEAARYLALPDGGSISIKSADAPDRLRGVGLDLVIVDEAAFISQYVWQAVLRPALADRRGRALMISTPRGRNWFYHAFQRGLDPLAHDWEAWRAPTSANGLIAPEEIADVRALTPERIFRQEYEAEFLEDGGEVFRGVRRAATAPVDAAPQPGHRYVAGIDWGRANDFTAVAILDATRMALVALDRFSGDEWALQRARIAALLRGWGVSLALAEENAMGGPNIEALQREGLPVRPFSMTALSKPPLIESLVLGIECGDLRLLPDEVLLGELESYTYQTLPSGRNRYGAPPGLHDDTVIALALAWKLAGTPAFTLSMAEV